MMTEFGGAVAVPSAVRNSDSTTTIRVNDVIMIRIDGAIDNTVSSAISWIARSVTPPLPWPRLMLMSCANAEPASDVAAIRVTRNKTLRGNGADLTKASLGGPAMTPSRLRDSQNRSSKALRPAAALGAQCGSETLRPLGEIWVRARLRRWWRRRGGGALGRANRRRFWRFALARRARDDRLVARGDTRGHWFGTQFGAGFGASAERLLPSAERLLPSAERLLPSAERLLPSAERLRRKTRQ